VIALVALASLEACEQLTRLDELLIDQNLFALNLLSRLSSRQAANDAIKASRSFFELPKVRQQTFEASAKRWATRRRRIGHDRDDPGRYREKNPNQEQPANTTSDQVRES
jgi:hypothetical protein